ncbi:CMP-N-acetylneuraminate-beta-galactosamide-alpha-2,3-sialyltransferase 1-like isoform X2 [Tyto alba]|uniref:CMP-N-acetylneuraminate-beta-galactosamide- alpha-2,3-sialyltransferase 1-like isoform X2 n=1 Tax=Tyto alba TaxID=56313 RepID=UPI001C680235|nr:CMP-N-acetylneuraminate-beta-galactosamide-alpha-2,3-sialyltransferase 1-like isoform X2 [Tyto alba]
MLCQRRTWVVLALCLLLVLWQSFRAPTDGLGSSPWAPSFDTPAAHCTVSTNSSAWFNARYNMAMGPLLTSAAHELSSDVVQWWLTLQGPQRGGQLQAIIQQLFTVLRTPTSDVWDSSRCRTCAVVGNSGRLKGSSHGLRIDAHDWVLRMNRAKITGFELDVGRRTTHHFMYPESAVNLGPSVHLVLVPFKPLDLQWVASAFSTGELTHTYVRVKQFIKADRNKVRAPRASAPPGQAGLLWAETGLVCVVFFCLFFFFFFRQNVGRAKRGRGLMVALVEGAVCPIQHSEQLMAPPLPLQVLILSPAFLKYIHDNWMQRQGRYPSTGFTALLFALHICQQVSVTSRTEHCHHISTAPLACVLSGRLSASTATALPGMCAGLCVWLWSRQ